MISWSFVHFKRCKDVILLLIVPEEGECAIRTIVDWIPSSLNRVSHRETIQTLFKMYKQAYNKMWADIVFNSQNSRLKIKTNQTFLVLHSWMPKMSTLKTISNYLAFMKLFCNNNDFKWVGLHFLVSRAYPDYYVILL